TGMPRVVAVERRRRRVEAPAPDLGLLVAVPGGGFRLVQPLERTVVALVEPPALGHRNPQLVELVECDPARPQRTLEHRGERDVEGVPLGAKQVSGAARLFEAPGAQIDVGPPGDPVPVMPGAFSVSDTYDLEQGWIHLYSCQLHDVGPTLLTHLIAQD